MQALIVVAIVLAVVAVLYLGVLTLILRFSLKPLRIHQYLSPGALGYPQENVTFTTSDGLELYGWWSPGESDVVVIAAHGYVMNRCEWVPVQTFLGPHQYSFLYFDLRAHGKSKGNKIGFGREETEDIISAIEWVKAKAPGKKIVLLGSSMGAVASARAASKYPGEIAALILDGPFRRLDEAMEGWWSFLGGSILSFIMGPSKVIAPWILGYHPRDLQVDMVLADLPRVPTLLLYGSNDPLIGEESVAAMGKSIEGRGEVVVFEGATHGAGRLVDPRRFENMVTGFLRENGLVQESQTDNIVL